jgi:hypothetical protein
MISLQEIARPGFELNVPEGSGTTAALIELKFWLGQKHGPRFYVCSKDVFETLRFNGLLGKLNGDKISKAVVKIIFPDNKRGKRVELSDPNKVKFKRATHAKEVFELLKAWELLSDESEDEEGDEDIIELHSASAAFAGSADIAATGSDAVSPSRTEST